MATENGGAAAAQLDQQTAQQVAAVLGPDVASFEQVRLPLENSLGQR